MYDKRLFLLENLQENDNRRNIYKGECSSWVMSSQIFILLLTLHNLLILNIVFCKYKALN